MIGDIMPTTRVLRFYWMRIEVYQKIESFQTVISAAYQIRHDDETQKHCLVNFFVRQNSFLSC